MNILFSFGVLLILAYVLGGLASRIGLPCIVDCMQFGIVFNPDFISAIKFDFVDPNRIKY